MKYPVIDNILRGKVGQKMGELYITELFLLIAADWFRDNPALNQLWRTYFLPEIERKVNKLTKEIVKDIKHARIIHNIQDDADTTT